VTAKPYTPLTMTQEMEHYIRVCFDAHEHKQGPQPEHKSCSVCALLAELDATRYKLAALTESHAACVRALRVLEREDMGERAADDGDEFVECGRCGAQDWGTLDVYDSGDADHRADCPYAALYDPLSLAVEDK
jgi:hypothetical protein